MHGNSREFGCEYFLEQIINDLILDSKNFDSAGKEWMYHIMWKYA